MLKIKYFLICLFLFYINSYEIEARKIKFDKCYEYQESIEKWKKDKYPDFKSIEIKMYKDNYFLVLNKKNNTQILYLLDLESFNKLKNIGILSDRVAFAIPALDENKKIRKSDLKKNKNLKDKIIYIEGDKNKSLKFYFNENHFYLIRYNNFINIFNKL